MGPGSIKKRLNINDVLMAGVSAGWPICLGYFPIGLAFGVLAQKAGLSPLQTAMMSIFVFAGSSQFVAVSMLSGGAAFVSIIITTLTINLRHLLMSSSLSVFLGKSKKRVLSLFAYGVTDESFAVNYIRFKEGKWDVNRALVVNHVANFAWVASTALGAYGGQFIPTGAFGIDYALIAMFISLLAFQLRGLKYIVTAIISGGVAVILSMLIPGTLYIVLASISAATIGVIVEKLKK